MNEQSEKKNYKRWWFWVIVGVIGLFVAFLAFAWLYSQFGGNISAIRGKGLVELKVNGNAGPEVVIKSGQPVTFSWKIDDNVRSKTTCYLYTGVPDTAFSKSLSFKKIEASEINFTETLSEETYPPETTGEFLLNCEPGTKEQADPVFWAYGNSIKFKITP